MSLLAVWLTTLGVALASAIHVINIETYLHIETYLLARRHHLAPPLGPHGGRRGAIFAGKRTVPEWVEALSRRQAN
jgi:hypothetical protein